MKLKLARNQLRDGRDNMDCQLKPHPGRGPGFYICEVCNNTVRGVKSIPCRGATVFQQAPRTISISLSDTVGFNKNPIQPHQVAEVVPKGKLKVGLITPAILMGGAELWMLTLIKNLDASLIEYKGLTITDGWHPMDRRLVPEFLELGDIYLGKNGLDRMSEKCDVLILWGVSEYGKVAPKNFKGKTILVSHGFGHWTDTVLRSCIPHSQYFAAVSEQARKSFSPDMNVKVIPNGADEERCKQLKKRDVVRREWGFDKDDKLVGYFGRVSYEKNVEAAPAAVKQLGRGYKTVIIGDGYAKDEILARCYAIDPDLKYILPMRPGDAIPALDCFVLASPSEGFSLALTEAWLCKCPTVITPVGGVIEVTEKFGLIGAMVPINPSAEELASAVKKAISDREMVEKAYDITKQHYTAAKMGEQWTRYLLEIGR